MCCTTPRRRWTGWATPWTISFYGIKGSHLDDIIGSGCDDMTPEEVNAAIRKHLRYENLQIVIVTKDARGTGRRPGHRHAQSDHLSRRPAPEVLKEDEEISRFPLKIKRENIRIIPVEKVFE